MIDKVYLIIIISLFIVEIIILLNSVFKVLTLNRKEKEFKDNYEKEKGV